MKTILATICFATLAMSASAQKFMTRTGKVTFFSSTPVENIEAYNNETAGAIDGATGDIMFIVPVKSFKFDKALMQEHFNENYMESDKFPKAEYRGKIANLHEIDLKKDGSYKVATQGKLTIHGVTKEVSVPGTIVVKGAKATVHAKFNVAPADYGIKIPSVAASKIAQKIEVTLNSELTQR